MASLAAVDGQLYFTPDTGELYIDIATATTPKVANSTQDDSTANRIRVNGVARLLANTFTVNGVVFDASAPKDAGTIKVAYGGTGATSFTDHMAIFSVTTNGVQKLQSATSVYIGNAGIGINQDHITAGYVLEVSGKSRFFDEVTFTGVVTHNANTIFNSSVTVDSLTAGSLVVSGNSSLVNTVTTSNVLPHTDNTYSLGSSSLRYKQIYGALVGNADTATEFSSAASVALTGVVTGSASSKKGWTITTSIGEGKITNAMLAGNITNGKLVTPYIYIKDNTHPFYLGDIIQVSDLLSLLGLTSGMHFVGHVASDSTYHPSDGTSGTPKIDGLESYTPSAGDMVMDKDSNAEYIYSEAGVWEIVGAEGTYKVKQTAVGSTNTTVNKWVGAIHQNANGDIDSIKYTELDTSGTWAGIATKAQQDEDGNTIKSTYLKVANISASTTSGNALAFIDSMTVSNGTVKFTKKNVQVADGSTAAGIVSTSEQSFGGRKTFLNLLKVTDTNDATSKTDTGASFSTGGGIAAAKRIAAEKFMVDDHVELIYDSATESLNFVFS